MKKLGAVWLVLFSFNCFSQVSIEPYPLQVGFNKTINIIFPYSVKSVDRGSKDILVQKNKGNENVLLVKAAKENFVATNMSVVTSDGKLYSFLVSYASDPLLMNISFDADTDKIQKPFLNIVSRNEQMKLALRSIYIDKHLLWFHFDIKNNSQIDFTPAYIKFFLEDKRKAKRTAEQQTELAPLFRLTMPVIPGQTKQQFAFAFDQFTLSKDKRMVCEISEENGGRLLTLHISNKILLKAKRRVNE
jgi:uncharacterized protein DUF4138